MVPWVSHWQMVCWEAPAPLSLKMKWLRALTPRIFGLCSSDEMTAPGTLGVWYKLIHDHIEKKKKTTHQSCALVARRERLWLAEHQLTVLSSTQKHLNLSDGREIRVCRQTSEDWLTVENGRKSTHALTRNYYTALSASCHFVTFDDIHQHNMDGMR